MSEEANQALWESAKAGDLEGVQAAVSQGADVNSLSQWDGTAMHMAASAGHVEILAFLLEHNADPLEKDTVDFIPLHLAARDGQPAAVKFLLDHGGRVPERTYTDILHVASMSSTSLPEIGEMLAKAHIKMIDPATGAASEADAQLLESAASGDVDGVQGALEHGADVNAMDGRGTSALRWATQREYADIVTFLLDAGADINAASYTGWTALLDACFFNDDVEMVRLLLEQGADVNHVTEMNGTALMFAALGGSLEMVKTLLEAGTDPRVAISQGEDRGMTALAYARSKGHHAVVELLEQAQ